MTAESETPAQSAEEVLHRMSHLAQLVVLHYQVVNWPRANGSEKTELAKIYETISKHLLANATAVLSPSERAIVDKPIDGWTTADELNVAWRMECIAVMAWAVRLLEAMPRFDEAFADLSLLGSFDSPRKVNDLKERVQLRSSAELDAFLTEAERWHWRARQAEAYVSSEPNAGQRRIIRTALGEDVSLFGKPYHELSFREFSIARSIASERHLAMNWIWDGEPWDEVVTDT